MDEFKKWYILHSAQIDSNLLKLLDNAKETIIKTNDMTRLDSIIVRYDLYRDLSKMFTESAKTYEQIIVDVLDR